MRATEFINKQQGVAEAVQNFNIGYHVTKKQNVPFIMKNGLVGGKTTGFTLGGEWADAIYGRRPIYVALDKDLYKDTETTELKIDLRGLRLVPDLPSLIDLGAMVSNNDSIYWKHDEDIPKLLMDYAEDGEIFYYDLLKNENVIRAAILSTRTAAILDSIPANKISTEFHRQGVAEGLNEFATGSGGGGKDDILKTLAAHWLNGDVASGDLDSDIQSQEKVERRLAQGIICSDGVNRKLYIDYSDDYEGVVIYSDDDWSITYKRDELTESKQGVSEAWSEKYKKSINCKNPKGFSQRAHCQGRKKK